MNKQGCTPRAAAAGGSLSSCDVLEIVAVCCRPLTLAASNENPTGCANGNRRGVKPSQSWRLPPECHTEAAKAMFPRGEGCGSGTPLSAGSSCLHSWQGTVTAGSTCTWRPCSTRRSLPSRSLGHGREGQEVTH